MTYEVHTLLILTVLEVILGVDNMIFIAIVSTKFARGGTLIRLIGLSLALILRVVLLTFLLELLKRDVELFKIGEFIVSLESSIMIIGGGFLLYKSVNEIIVSDILRRTVHERKKSEHSDVLFAIMQVVGIDVVFSVDSILTAVALTDDLAIIIPAFAVAILVMLVISQHVVSIMHKYPSIKTIALVFIGGVGGMLILHGLHFDVSKNYLYCAFIFALIIEVINIMRTR